MSARTDDDATTPPDAVDLHKLIIEINYRTSDRFGAEQHGDPHQVHAQQIHADIVGLDEAGEYSLGTLSLARIDLWQGGSEIYEVLDSHSGHWTAFYDVLKEAVDENLVGAALILDQIKLVDWARGSDLGLHVLARAIRTWGEDSIVVLTAWPIGGTSPDADAGGEALARHWAKLGLHRVAGTHPPVLSATTDSRELEETITRLCAWPPE